MVWNGYFILFEGLAPRADARASGSPGIRVVMDTGHAVTHGRRRRAQPAPGRRLPSAALPDRRCCWWRSIPRGKRLGDLVAGTVVSRDRPHEAPARSSASPRRGRAALDSRAGRRDVPAAGPVRRAAGRARARRRATRLAAGARGSAGRAPGAGRARATWRTCSPCTPPSWPAAQGGSAARGAAGAGTRFAAQKRAALGRVRAAGRARGRAGPRQLRLARAARLRRPLSRGRGRPGAGAHLPARTPATLSRLERLAAAGHNALYRDERSTWRRIWVVLARECPAAVVEARAVRAASPSSRSSCRPRPASPCCASGRPSPPSCCPTSCSGGRRPGAAARRRAGGTWTWRRRTGRSWRRASSPTTSGSPSPASPGGIFLGVGSLVLLAYNGLVDRGLRGPLRQRRAARTTCSTFILGHGALELFAIWVAGAAGFLLGRSVVAPGRLSRADALVLSGRLAVRMVGGDGAAADGGGDDRGVRVGGRRTAWAARLGGERGQPRRFWPRYLLNGVRARAASSASGSPAPRSPGGW